MGAASELFANGLFYGGTLNYGLNRNSIAMKSPMSFLPVKSAGLVCWLLVATCFFWGGGCASHQPGSSLQHFTYAELHMGTMFEIQFFARDKGLADGAAEAAFTRIAALDQIMSDYIPTSELRQLSSKPAGQRIEVSADLYRVLEHAEEVARKSNGAFDVTLGPLIKLWRDSRRTKVLPHPAQIAEAKQVCGYTNVVLSKPARTISLLKNHMVFDLGGIAKGYAADAALEVLRRRGITRAMVAASGDIAAGDPPVGKRGWKVGIQSIDQQGRGITESVWLANAGISTSGDTEQFVEIGKERYSHIVDPKTGLGLTERIGVTIIARNATASDAWATAASVLGSQGAKAAIAQQPDKAALIIKLRGGEKECIQIGRFNSFVGRN